MFEMDIYRAVSECPEVWADISGQFYWDVSDGNAEPPLLVAQVVSDNVPGVFGVTGGASFPVVQITSWAESRLESNKIAANLIGWLDGKVIPGDTETAISLESRTSTFDTETRWFGTILRFQCHVQFS